MLRAIDPTTGKLVREVPAANAAERERLVAAADTAQTSWRRSTLDQRSQVLKDVAKSLRADRERLAMLMAEEMGKPIREGRAEVDKAAWCAEHYAERGPDYLASESVASDATRSYVQYLPLGVVLGVLPWNAPLWLAFRFCAPALMAGNTCLMKHDPHVPGCAAGIADAFEAAGAPTGLLVNLPILNQDVEAVIRDPRVKAVSFTGSDQAGARVAAIAASEIKPTVLELGGSDPALVLADADIDQAAKVLALSRIINAGQSCIAAKRILVEDEVFDRFVDRLNSRLAALVLGDPRDENTDVGPIAREDLRDNLARQVRQTIESGATCLLGGEPSAGDGFFYPVTLLTEASPESAAFCEETFGPVAVVTRVTDADHALELANQTPYGLAAAIWTATDRGEVLARQIEAGQVSVNGIVKTDPRLPSGGIKRSGYGRELGRQGILEFVNAQQVWVGPTRV